MSWRDEIEDVRVVFRRWPNGDVIALFPEIEADPNGNCSSYMHVGQHGPADYAGCISATKPAQPKEYKTLARELESMGYRLTILKKFYRKRVLL